jgi:mannose-6-phosphate isomerase-like protein (cupin superfamily)
MRVPVCHATRDREVKEKTFPRCAKMKKLFVGFLLAIPLLLGAQATAPEGFEHWTTADLGRVGHDLTTAAASDPHHFAVKQLGDFPNEAVLLVHREADGQVEWHETQIDIFFVQSGSATLVVGGTYLNGETVAPHEKRNGTIQGGSRQKLSAGDIVRIPARTPHQVLLDGAHEFTYFVVKAKGY